MSNQYPVNKSIDRRDHCRDNDRDRCDFHHNHHHNHHDCQCHHKEDFHCHRKIDCEPEKVVFKCKNLQGATLNAIEVAGIFNAQPVSIASISSPDLCCFKKPCVKLEVSGIITASIEIGILSSIVFKVFKRCGREEEQEIATFTIALPLLEIGVSTPFTLSLCDCDDFCARDNCCRYRVTAEVSGLAEVASFNIGQGTISLIAGDAC